MPAHNGSALVQVVPLGIGFAGVALHKGRIVPVGHEADVLAVVLPGGDKALEPGNFPNLGLGQLPQREEGVGQHLLGQGVQEIGLVLLDIRCLI